MFVIIPSHRKMKRFTRKEYEALQSALKSNDRDAIVRAGVNWNSSLEKFRQKHPEV